MSVTSGGYLLRWSATLRSIMTGSHLWYRNAFRRWRTIFCRKRLPWRSSSTETSNPLRAFSLHASCQSVQLAKDCLNEIKSKLKTTDIDRLLLDYFQLSAEGCGMPYDQRVIR